MTVPVLAAVPVSAQPDPGIPSGTPSPRESGWPRLAVSLVILVAVLVSVIVAAAAIFYGTGGRWFIVTTPSMGQAAPVGTLVFTTPVRATDDLSVEQIISFRPPTTPTKIYTHRIVSIDGGVINTRGDINGAIDPWSLDRSDVIGRVIALFPTLGWIVRAAPLVMIGAIGVGLFARRFIASPNRRAAWIIGMSFVLAAVAFILKPFVAIAVIASGVTDGRATATIVSTGLLPIRAEMPGGTHVDLVNGMVGTVSAPSLGPTGHYGITTALNLTPLEWGILAIVCAIPLLLSLIGGSRAARNRATT